MAPLRFARVDQGTGRAERPNGPTVGPAGAAPRTDPKGGTGGKQVVLVAAAPITRTQRGRG
jgi:hypothetical protein